MIHVIHVRFMFFAVFKNLKSSFSEDNMPVHTLYVFIENAAKWFELSHETKQMRIKLKS